LRFPIFLILMLLTSFLFGSEILPKDPFSFQCYENQEKPELTSQNAESNSDALLALSHYQEISKKNPINFISAVLIISTAYFQSRQYFSHVRSLYKNSAVPDLGNNFVFRSELLKIPKPNLTRPLNRRYIC